MEKLTRIIHSIITNLPGVSSISEIQITERRGNFYVYFSKDGQRYRVDENLGVETVDGSTLSFDKNAQVIQEQLRG